MRICAYGRVLDDRHVGTMMETYVAIFFVIILVVCYCLHAHFPLPPSREASLARTVQGSGNNILLCPCAPSSSPHHFCRTSNLCHEITKSNNPSLTVSLSRLQRSFGEPCLEVGMLVD